jgi:hypothetical protein
LARENFKNPQLHSCQEEFEQVLDKFQGNLNKLIEEDTSDIESILSGNQEEEKNEVQVLQRKLKILERKNHVLMGGTPNLV